VSHRVASRKLYLKQRDLVSDLDLRSDLQSDFLSDLSDFVSGALDAWQAAQQQLQMELPPEWELLDFSMKVRGRCSCATLNVTLV
jgi:hypothetical protein